MAESETAAIAAALRKLSDELVERVREGCPDGSAAYACGAVEALADRLNCTIAPERQSPIPDATRSGGQVGTYEDFVRQRELEATANTLAVTGVLLRKVADYWDGRPLKGHGDHIYADLMDVLRAIDADEKHNREQLVIPPGAST